MTPSAPSIARRRRFLALLLGVVGLFTIACDDIVLQNPLPSIVDARVEGRWVDAQTSQLAFLIRRAEGQGYDVWTAEDLENKAKPTRWYLSQAGGRLVVESATSCDGHQFKVAVSDAQARGNVCWAIAPLALGASEMRTFRLDAASVVRHSERGGFAGISHQIGIGATSGGARVSCVLLEGPAGPVADALGRYLQLPEAYQHELRHLRRI